MIMYNYYKKSLLVFLIKLTKSTFRIDAAKIVFFFNTTNNFLQNL